MQYKPELFHFIGMVVVVFAFSASAEGRFGVAVNDYRGVVRNAGTGA